MNIEWLGMTRQHYQRGTPDRRVRMVVIHATAGRAPADLNWLRRGGDERRPVSVHYYIAKNGRIVQLVREEDIAWHAGRSVWTVDGKVVENCNAVSIGIELENLNTGRDPYPEAQYAAALALTRDLVRRYDVPRGQLVRHLDIAPGRKTDPAGFPWERFVHEVYADADEASVDPSTLLPALMRDLAFRSAGAALPAVWPLWEAAQAAGLGMPVAAVNGRPLAPSPASAQDDRDRTVRLPGLPPLVVEAYARDLLYAPALGPYETPSPPGAARRLADTPPGALRDALLAALFRAVDPVNGFRSDWAFHQYWLGHTAELGMPIGPNHRITVAGSLYACQHFALDSLCSPIGDWKTIYRLSELASSQSDRAPAAALHAALLDDLYRSRTGRRYDPTALLVRSAAAQRLGAPLAPPEVTMVAGQPYLLMAFALDVLACRLPHPTWPLDRPLPEVTPVIALSTPLPPSQGFTDEAPGALLGEHAVPPFLDLDYSQNVTLHTTDMPLTLCIAAAPGPAAADLRLQTDARRWHYYVDTSGTIYRFGDEQRPHRGGANGMPEAVIGVEGGSVASNPAQRAALVWLVRTVAGAWGIPPSQIRVVAEPRSPAKRSVVSNVKEEQ